MQRSVITDVHKFGSYFQRAFCAGRLRRLSPFRPSLEPLPGRTERRQICNNWPQTRNAPSPAQKMRSLCGKLCRIIGDQITVPRGLRHGIYRQTRYRPRPRIGLDPEAGRRHDRAGLGVRRARSVRASSTTSSGCDRGGSLLARRLWGTKRTGPSSGEAEAALGDNHRRGGKEMT